MPDNFAILLVSDIIDMGLPVHLFINSDAKKFCLFNLLYFLWLLIATLTGMFAFFLLVLNIIKFDLMLVYYNLTTEILANFFIGNL